MEDLILLDTPPPLFLVFTICVVLAFKWRHSIVPVLLAVCLVFLTASIAFEVLRKIESNTCIQYRGYGITIEKNCDTQNQGNAQDNIASKSQSEPSQRQRRKRKHRRRSWDNAHY